MKTGSLWSPSGASWAPSFGLKVRIHRSDPDQYAVAGRDELGFEVNDQRKNRKAHRSQRKGLTNILARILSKIPMRLD
jgi:hypothetical protein